MGEIHHYPAANQEPAKSYLAEFLWGSDYVEHHGRLLMGNGASELIDLVVRKALLSCEQRGIKKPTWKGSPWNVQVSCDFAPFLCESLRIKLNP